MKQIVMGWDIGSPDGGRQSVNEELVPTLKRIAEEEATVWNLNGKHHQEPTNSAMIARQALAKVRGG